MSLAIILLDLLTFIIGMSLGTFVFLKNPKNKIFQIFALTVLGMAGWNLCIFLLLAGIGPAIIPGRLTFSFGVLLLTGFSLFVFHFPRTMRWGKQLSWIFGIGGLIFFIIPLAPQFVSYVEIVDGMITGDLNPVLFGVSTLYYLISYLITFVILVARAIKAVGVDRKRLLQVLFGFSLFLFPMLTTQLFLPLIFQDFRWNNLGPAFSIFLVAFLANAILSYRLLNIKWIVGRSAFFSVIIGAILWVIVSASLLIGDILNSQIALVAGAFVIAVFFEPIWHLLERLFLKVIHSGSYNPEVARREIFDLVRDEGELSVLMSSLVERFSEYFSALEVEMLVLSTKNGSVVSEYSEGFKISHSKNIGALKKIFKTHKNEIVEISELEWTLKYSHAKKKGAKKTIASLKKMGIRTLVPFTVNNHVVGVMIFGERRFDKALTDGDIKFLDFVRSGISPALENAAKFEEIKKLYVELAELDRAKTEFIDVVSHRFRTPLSSMRWNLEMVLDSAGQKLNKDSRGALDDVHDRSLFLISTLDRLFETLDIESGHYKLNREVFDARKAFEELNVKYTEACKANGTVCSFDVKKINISGDKAKLIQLCGSLLTNAAQYTPEGGTITFEVKESERHVIIVVKDTGIGIPAGSLDKIWDKFYRAKNAILTYADGQGLGLFFVKKIVDLHRGTIRINSTVGKGTEFVVTLPKGAARKKAKK